MTEIMLFMPALRLCTLYVSRSSYYDLSCLWWLYALELKELAMFPLIAEAGTGSLNSLFW